MREGEPLQDTLTPHSEGAAAWEVTQIWPIFPVSPPARPGRGPAGRGRELSGFAGGTGTCRPTRAWVRFFSHAEGAFTAA